MLTTIISAVTPLLDKFIPDADEKNRLVHEIATLSERLAHENAMAQIEVNKTEAQHASVFVSGWRPAVGWICAIALGYHFILQPMLTLILSISGIIVDLPTFDMTTLTTVLMGMLGFGGLRTYEKIKGVERK
jgi:hypothetical protein